MKLTINAKVNACMLAAFAACGMTGILKTPELGVDFGSTAYGILSAVHDRTGIVGLALLAIHLALHSARFRALAGKRLARFAKPGMTALALIAFSSLAGAPAWAMGDKDVSSATTPRRVDYRERVLIDGAYDGSATGFEPALRVRVTVRGGKIAGIEIVEDHESWFKFRKVAKDFPGLIVESQSTAIDSVSGATFSSHGFLSAVEDALKGAE